MSNESDNDNKVKPIISFGIITDVQYADHDARLHTATKRFRYYRNGLVILRDALRHWKDSKRPIGFILQVGDLIDRINGPDEKCNVLNNDLLKLFSDTEYPTYHVLGNHELYTFSYKYLRESPINTAGHLDYKSNCEQSKFDYETSSSCLGDNLDIEENTGSAEGMYYHFSPASGFRVVVLNTYEVTTQGHDTTSPEYVTAMDLLTSYRQVSAGSPEKYNESNGAVTSRQLTWLDEVLTKAGNLSETVIVTGHTPIHEKSADIFCICWNHHEIRSVLERHRHIVIGYLGGHDHAGGYYYDNGIHYVTLHGAVDTPPGDTCYATAHLYQDKLEIIGTGRMPNYTLCW